jgi:hypothetical protein
MLVACGAWLVGLGFYFIVLRPPLLPEDVRFLGTTIDSLRSSLPGLERWLSKVFTVMGGFMAGAGVLTVFIARTAIPFRMRGTGLVVAFTGVLTVALMSAANFVLQSDFKWILLGPPLLWFSALLSYMSGSKPVLPGQAVDGG